MTYTWIIFVLLQLVVLLMQLREADGGCLRHRHRKQSRAMDEGDYDDSDSSIENLSDFEARFFGAVLGTALGFSVVHVIKNPKLLSKTEALPVPV